MLFNSWGYVLFLILAVPMHWLVPHRFRMWVLCGWSLLFYAMWKWQFLFIMLFSAWLDYVCSRRIAGTDRPGWRKFWLILDLTLNLGLLVGFKYTYFIHDNVRMVGGLFGFQWRSLREMGIDIILPLGISFYTFQTISYTIDIYRRVFKPVNSFLTFLTYVTFWPQLIAGPILRVGEVIPQLVEERRPSLDAMASGLFLVVCGLFKKIVLADGISPMVDAAFNGNLTGMSAFDVWVANFLFGFQIYCDFAGYSDIGIGSAMMIGLYFPDNFNWPYMALSPKELWTRWHISLSAWIRDYLYLPLCGERFRTDSTGGIAVAAAEIGSDYQAARTRALFLTWFIMGLWHGAGWTFALWGLYHAVAIYLYRRLGVLRNLPKRAPIAAWALMLCVTMASWIPFRCQNLSDSLVMFSKIVNPLAYNLSHRALPGYAYLTAALLVLGMVTMYIVQRPREHAPVLRPIVWPIKGLAVSAMIFLILMLMRPVKQFIYFQF